MKIVILACLFFPLVAFFVAGVLELRSNRSRKAKLCSLVPIILGIAAFGVSWAPEVIASSWTASGRAMAMVFAVIACSGAFINYSQRVSSVLIALGGLELAFVSIFFSQVVR